MPVANITRSASQPVASIGNAFSADNSPFGGTILFAGQVAFPTSNNLEYRVMVKGPSDLVAKPWTKSFDVWVTTVIGGFISFNEVTQTANGDWFEYIPQSGPVYKSVAGNLLAPFHGDRGRTAHRLHPGARGWPRHPATANRRRAFFVDNTRPVVDVEITSGDGNCSTFQAGGEPISGTFSMTDLHSGGLSLEVTPHPESDPGNLIITAAAPPGGMLSLPKMGPGASNGLSYALLTLDGSGATGNWELETGDMAPCGYNIRIVGTDRTIVNSSGNSWWSQDIEGFCLLAAPPVG